MFRFVLTAALLCSITWLTTGISFAEDEVLATVGDKKITLSDLNRTIGYLDSQKQQMVEQNPQLKEQLLTQMVQSMVVSDLARKAGIDKDADFIGRLEFYKENFLATEYLKREVVDNITVPDDEAKSYYNEHKDEFPTPERIHVRHILIKVDEGASEEDKKLAKEKAEDILKKIKSGEDFEKLASEFSDDTTTKSKGGDIGFVARGRLVKPFEDAAFALKPGEVSDIVETTYGYHIIKVEEKKEEGTDAYDLYKDRIKQSLSQEHIQSAIAQFLDKAMKDAGVEIHNELLTGAKKEE